MISNKISPQSSVNFVRWRTSALKAKAYGEDPSKQTKLHREEKNS
jgi:hypothetical protein